jgi:hypothetical protein
MRLIQKFFDFYINSSIHVGLSVYALVRLTGILFHISDNEAVAFFAFSGTIVGYNFVKYDALARTQKLQASLKVKAIAVLSFIAAVGAVYFFLQLARITQLIAFLFLFVTMLYTLPFFPNRKNARNWAGVKIYIVALCWVGVTLFLPIVNAGIPFTAEVLWVAVQRFILIFVLVLIFEIIDLQEDDPNLKTVPQQIGVNHTKWIGSLLLVFFVLVEFLAIHYQGQTSLVKMGLAITTLLLLLLANENRPRYYASFWTESIPVLWWILVLLSTVF